MKYKIAIFVFLYLCGFVISAQTLQTTTHKLAWDEPVKWYLDSTSVDVISFAGAKYPLNNRLPYFNQRITCDKAFSYQAELKNPVYIPLTNEENVIITGNSIPNEVTVQTNILSERGSNYFDINILPFAVQDGKILKLTSFDLQISKTKLPQKISSTSLHTFAASSVLAQGRFVKIKVTNSGIYKLTFEDLKSMGIDPANVRIFGYGGGILEQSFSLDKIDDLPEDAIWMEKGSDGVFNAGDYILFYAQGINRWAYDKSKSMFTHFANYYSKYGYYFVTSDAGVGKKIVEKSINVPQAATINNVEEFTDYQVYEKDIVNLVESGKEFYGETFNEMLSLNIPLSFPNPVSSNSTRVRLDVAANSTVNTSFVLSLNGSQAKTLPVSYNSGDMYTRAIGTSGTYLFTPSTDQLSFNLTYNKSTSSSSVGYLNYLEVNVRRQLKMSGSMMQFQNVDYLGAGTYNRYMLSNANANVQIWDITDPANISKVVTSLIGGKLTFIDSGNDVKRYVAIDPTASSDFPKPEIGSVVPNQDLHAMGAVDMVIITHPDFLSQANILAQAHREIDNLTVAVVTTDEVYNEFSSGAPDATAYRWIMKMFYDRALAANNTVDIPKYLLLFGRGTYDNRKLISNSGDNFILTYQADNSLKQTDSYVTDDYFALLDDNEGENVMGGLMDIGVGRFPVTTAQQASDVVNKTIGYMKNSGKGIWKNQLCFLADDGDQALHMRQADTVAESVGKAFPAYQLNKIYLDAYVQEISASGQSYPLAKSRFQNLLRSGLFLLNYTGHAGASGWTNESILSNADVKALSNQHLPLWIGATCDFLQFDVQIVSAGEQVLLNPVGGGVGILSAARPVYASQNLTIDKFVCDDLFKKQNGSEKRIGDVISAAKNKVGSEINKLCYVYMGDPAVKLNYPTKFQVITTKVNDSTSFGNDTLRAMSVANIQGIIADENGNKISDYNGTLQAVVYDKVQRITTLNNEHDGALTYSDRPNTLFSGNTEIVDGAFSFSFRLPKDIKYNFGTGRINYYAQNNTTNDEAQGSFENFLIGGTDTNYIDETDGPAVQLYLNSKSFVSGDKVNETPLFMADISDIDGINTVGSGIGHDVMLTIDHDPAQSYILNEYFQAAPNSYTDGT
ncbi:MAG: type IX secretion system sortase PorU, partial [Paludibacter sp.]|nr:type IX secretion system sortase PorU [Paludibacter sp.]